MKIVIIAAIAPGGVIGRSKKPCEACGGRSYREQIEECRRCTSCDWTGTVPCNELPWPPGTYPEDMEHFKKVTMGHAVVMGRNTKESIPSKFFPLEGRTNIVVSETLWRERVGAVAARTEQGIRPEFPDTLSWPKFMPQAVRGHEKLYVIGGARLYAEALPIADELDLTLVSKKWDGDVTFPSNASFQWGGVSVHGFVRGGFECVSNEPCPTNPDLIFTRWVRRP